ncbi:MAG: peptidoglycan recognition family protein [Planctomycetota bacterium]|nr:peptidoglycan recognition family protein [Planctomycetota bacterium]
MESAAGPSQAPLSSVPARLSLARRLSPLVLALSGACLQPGADPQVPAPVEAPEVGEAVLPAERKGQELVACGQLFHVGVPVVLWYDQGGYDAYSTALHFDAPASGRAVEDGELRYQPGRRVDGRPGEYQVTPGSKDLEALQGAVDLFVVHYDACGCSRQCFKILHDRRCLSVQFMLDVDGTVYQTLDLRERAWHAAKANTRSVGVEIANFGARRVGDEAGLAALEELHPEDEQGRFVEFPAWMEPLDIRTPGFRARPRHPERIEGPMQGGTYAQYDFTAEQYASLARLNAALCRVLPRIEPDAPRDASGRVLDRVLDDATYESFSGVVGHHHVSAAKQDPGPAFDWEGHLASVRALLGAP